MRPSTSVTGCETDRSPAAATLRLLWGAGDPSSPCPGHFVRPPAEAKLAPADEAGRFRVAARLHIPTRTEVAPATCARPTLPTVGVRDDVDRG